MTLTRSKATATMTLPLEKSDDSYQQRWILPWSIRLKCPSKHNPGADFDISLFETTEEAEKWWGVGNGGPFDPVRLPEGMIGSLNARATIIASHYFPTDYYLRVPVDLDTRLRTYIGVLEIRDDWSLHPPYFVRAS